MPSHIAFFNFPAIGHVNPTLGVVEELVKRGHRVTCTATEHFAPAIEAIGAEVVPHESVFGEFYRSPYTEEANAGEGMRCLDDSTGLVEQVGPFYEKNRPDVIVHDFMAWGARFYGAKHDIPLVRLYPTYGANEHFSIQEKFPLATYEDPQVMEMIGKLAGLLPEFNLPADPVAFFTSIEKLGIIFLPRDFHYDGDTFDERFVFAGPSLGDRSFQGAWEPASADRPVLLISLGTAATGWAEFFRMAVEAFGDTEWDVVMAVGDHIDTADLGALPANFDVRRHVPQLEVLRHAKLFVTHGGMNSVMESLYNGVPMVVIPQMNEQKANALRVDELGLGRHLTKDDTTVDSLREAVTAVAADSEATARVKGLGEVMRQVDGPAVAADAIEKFLAQNAG
ncbi:UDP-glucosyltransferase [Streptomyces sp. ISL-44]|uniref:macrolide family glycosyltransferase n=1 Tax=Streptomyces sp. ISL-44 TaxID=2819184 RepID=UPI001BE930DA|nr:macrolide family glycosyltransferase [Streptomyces sp. ISL-44]MBT2542112.1 UDP-glucosyltransferase [Streptomyces sp. ISL-44]